MRGMKDTPPEARGTSEKARAIRAKSRRLHDGLMSAIESERARDSGVVELLEEWRKERYFSQGQMAALLGIRRGQYSAFKDGLKPLTKPAMFRAYRLGIPAEEIILSIQN